MPKELAALNVHTTTEVSPSTLPKLRYGNSYSFRLRTVDLAGNSLDLDAAPGEVTTKRLQYLRYDPVGPPVVAPTGATADFDPGASLHRMVIEQPVPLGFPTNPRIVTERLLLPPQGSLTLAEQHGALDDALGVEDHARRSEVRALLPRADAELTLPVGAFAPYLPDPQAKGVVFTGLPGLPDGEAFPVEFDHGETWADVRPIRLRPRAPLSGFNPVAPRFDPATRTLTVELCLEGRSQRVRAFLDVGQARPDGAAGRRRPDADRRREDPVRRSGEGGSAPDVHAVRRDRS